jgi:hypothetical protein
MQDRTEGKGRGWRYKYDTKDGFGKKITEVYIMKNDGIGMKMGLKGRGRGG